MEMVYVPAGNFLMGSRKDDPLARDNEKPQHEVYLDPYWIDKTPVTNAMFTKFVAETGYVTEAEKAGFAWGPTKSIKGAQWRHPRGPNSNISAQDNHPVVSVSWNDAVAYANRAGRRLPTEAEWEKAAGGTDGRKWPWGNNPPTDKLCNFNGRAGGLTPVGNYPDGASPYGALDMVGNDLEPYLGSWEKIYGVLSRQKPLTLKMIRKLHEGLGIPAEILIRPPSQVMA
jgi:formylglycine-generating enzyme required for sulfatase activity